MTRTINRIFAGLLLALTAAITPQAAEARREWPLFGGGLGDAGVTVQCPPGEAIVGFAGRAGAWMDQVRILCAQVQADGTFGEPHPGSDGVGGPGGGPTSDVCDRQSRIQDVAIDRSDDGKKISTLRFHCVTKDGEQTFHGLGGTEDYCPSVHNIIATGCDPGENATMQSCPNEQFVGAKIRFGKDVNAIGFICDQVAAAPVAAVPAPAPPKIEKPVKLIGHAPNPGAPARESDGPHPVTAQSFRGTWQTVTGENGHFELSLGVAPPIVKPARVAGTFTNTDGAHQYDGKLEGIVQPGTLELDYTYTQNNGASGKGTFQLSVDGQSLTGAGDQTSPSPLHFTWNGTREPGAN